MSRSGYKPPGIYGPPPLTCWCCGVQERQSGCVRGLICHCTPLVSVDTSGQVIFSDACHTCHKCVFHCQCPPLGEGEYRCALCRQVYQQTRSDEEALAETQQYWPGITKDQSVIVCDDCWEKIKPEDHPQQYEESLRELGRSDT